MNPQTNNEKARRTQAGSGILSAVMTLGLILLLIQGTTWYRAKASAKFLGSEKNKVLAMQMAEAGVEENIADLAKKDVRAAAGMTDVSTYSHKPLDGGAYSSTLTTVSLGPVADTVDVNSVGYVGTISQSIQTRLRLNKHLDTTRTVLSYVEPETTATIATVMKPDTVLVLPPNAATMPAINTTAAWTACMASAATKCKVCHLPMRPSPVGRNVLNESKGFNLNSHISHIGDYVTTDGTCDMYDTTKTITMASKLDTTYAIVDKSLYDTTVSIDTAFKVQVLSWR